MAELEHPAAPSDLDGSDLPAVLQRKCLTGRRVFLRPVLPSDYETLQAIETAEYLGPRWRHGGTTPSADQFLRRISEPTLAQFLVSSQRTGGVVGIVGSYGADFMNGHAYFLAAKFTADVSPILIFHGFVLLIDYLFSLWPFRKLYAETVEYNFAEFRSAVGRLFEIEGCLREHRYLDGRYWNQYLLALYRETWEGQRERYARSVGL